MRYLLASVLIILGACTHAPPARIGAIDAVLAGFPEYAGVVAVSRDSEIVHLSAYGLKDRTSRTPHTPDEVFRFASVSKMITALLVLQEVDQGKMSLDAPVANYLADSGVANADRITLRQLLAHRSGLAEQADLSIPGPDGRIADVLEYCRASTDEPGAGFRYNNCDTIILGLALEAVTRQDYLSLVNDRLASIGVKLALPSGPRIEGYMQDGSAETGVYPQAFGPAGGLYGTARDLLAIDNALMEGKLISKASLAEMLKGDANSGYAALSVWSYAPDLKACLGETRLVERYGEIYGVQVRNFLLPDLGIAVVLYTNDRKVEFGEIWRGQGLSIDLLRAAACG